MSLWNPRSWGRQKPAQQKASEVGPIVSMSYVGQPVWTEHDYANLARESYNLNAVAFRCVKLIAEAAAGVPFCLYSRKDEIEAHPVLDLLDRPAPGISRKQMLEALFAYLLLSGNSYLEAVGPDGKPPRELWNHKPHRCRVIPGASGLPMGYEYEYQGRRHIWEADQLTGLSDLLHLREFSPLDDWYGQSRIQAAAMAIDRHNAASAHNKALLDNGARPSGALVFKPIDTGTAGKTSAPLDVVQEAERRLTDKHVGAANAGKPFVFSADVEWIEMGINPKDMDFGQGKDDAAREICTAIGVPHLLIVPGGATYNNVREAKLELYEQTVIPLVEHIRDGFNWWLVPRFSDGLMLQPDLDAVPALEPRRETKRNTTIGLYDKGLLTKDEAREALGYGPAEGITDIDPGTVNALLGAAPAVGLDPLVLYLKSVGLFEPGMTTDEIIAAATALIDDTAQDEDLAPEDEDAGDEQADDLPEG